MQLATLTAELEMQRSRSAADALSRGEAGVTAMKLAEKVEALSQVSVCEGTLCAGELCWLVGGELGRSGVLPCQTTSMGSITHN